MYNYFTGLDSRWCSSTSCESNRIARRLAMNRTNWVQSSTISHTLFMHTASRLPVRLFDFAGDDSRRIVNYLPPLLSSRVEST